MAPGRPFTRDTTTCRQDGVRPAPDCHHHTTGPCRSRLAHLAILQGHDPGVLCAADDIVVLRDALHPWHPESLQAVPPGG